MLSAENIYTAVNVVLGVACLIALFLVPKSIPAKKLRVTLIVALVVMILASGAHAVCQHFFRLYTLAYFGDAFGVTEGAFETVDKFRILSPIGGLLELTAVGLLAFIGKGLVSLRVGEQPEGGSEK